MPLYACDRCGFTSAALRPDADSAHCHEYPECNGAMRIVFRSDNRYRGYAFAAQDAATMTGLTQADGEAPSVARRPFSVRERVDVDGMLRLTVLGELDLAVAEVLSERLKELKATGRPVRLDLSTLAFIDSSGVQALPVAITDARSTGWQLEVAPEVSPSVERAAQIVWIPQVLWPEQRPDARSYAADAGTQRARGYGD